MFKQTKSFGKICKSNYKNLSERYNQVVNNNNTLWKKGVKRTKDNKQMLQQRVIALLELLESNPSGKRPKNNLKNGLNC